MQIEAVKLVLREFLRENIRTKPPLKRDEFYKLMTKIPIEMESRILDKIFWYFLLIQRIFDDDSNGLIDYKEIAAGIDCLTETDTEDKIERKCRTIN